jgi:hypothetical protein
MRANQRIPSYAITMFSCYFRIGLRHRLKKELKATVKHLD